MTHHSVYQREAAFTFRVFSLLLILWLDFTATTSGQGTTKKLPPSLPSGKRERLSTVVKAELVRGKTIDLEADLDLIFKTGTTTYSTLKPGYEQFLVLKPVVDTPQGITAEILETRVSKCDIDVITGVGEGYSIRCRVQVNTENNVSPGDHSVIVALPAVSEIAKALRAISPTETPTCTFQVKVYESEEARAAEVKANQARIDAEKRRQEAVISEQARKKRQLYYMAGGAAAGLLGLGLLVAYFIPWIAPTYRVNVNRGHSARITGSLTRTVGIKASETQVDPTFVDQTYWARRLWGASADIKARIISESAHRTVKETVTTTTYDDGHHNSSSSYRAETKYQLTITVTVGSSVSPGQYMARTEAGSLLIRVS